MIGLALELRTECGNCQKVLPVNAFLETVTCDACLRVTRIDLERWKAIVENAFAGLNDLADGEGKNTVVIHAGETYELTYGRQAPRCDRCRTQIPDEALSWPDSPDFAERTSMFCAECGQRISLRRAPGVFAEQGARILVGEDFAQLGGSPGTAPRGGEPVALHCPQCRAPLSVDGSSRRVRCRYCSTDVYLPDELWLRLHPSATVARWYAGIEDAALASRQRRTFRWYSFADGVVDAQGNIFCAGEDAASDKFAVWSMGPDLAVRWVRDDLKFDEGDARLALDPRGRLLIWQPVKASLVVLSVTDGATIGKLGGKEPENATAHYLDLSDAKQVMVDVDGTILALLAERLVRFADDGSPLATWPPLQGLFGSKPEKLRPLYGPGRAFLDVEGVAVAQVGSRPIVLREDTRLCIGWDGRLYAECAQWVACFDREGKRLYRVKLEVDSVRGGRIAADRMGRLYVVARRSGDPPPRVILRVASDGSRVDVLADDQLGGGVVGGEEHLIVTSEGALVLLDWGHRVRVLEPDGRLRARSDKSRVKDEDERREVAEGQ